MSSRPSSRSRRAVSLAVLGGLVTLCAACGNRLPESEILAKNAGSGSIAMDGGSAGGGSTGSTSGTSPGSTGSTTGTTTGSSGTTGATGSTGASGSSSSTSGTGSSGAGSGSGSGTSTTGTGPKQNTAPITIGFVGALSGAGGVFVTPVRDAMLAWAKMVNARGGINGHPVKVLVGDDGINDSRSLSIARDFVENQGAVALAWSSNDISGIANYAKSKHVPVIGTQTSQQVWYQNPYLFPMSPGYTASGWAEARAIADAGGKKVALLYCIEAPASCKTAADQVSSQAASVGIQIVYEAGVSITAPDYTSECLQARNKGADAVLMFADQASLIRLAKSCHRQSYKPILLGPGGDDMVSEPDLDGLVSAGTIFPWFLRSGSPGLSEYAQALSKYAPNLLNHGGSAQTAGWLTAKLFEQAASQVPANGKPTSQDILNGLWAMRGYSALGLAPGKLALTFTKLQPATDTFCELAGQLRNGKWTALNGGVPKCR